MASQSDIYILPLSKGNDKLKFDQFIEYNKRNNFLQKSYRK